MSHLTQPQIDPGLMLLRPGFLHGNHYVDLYGSFCALERQFEVEAVALGGTTIDISDFVSLSDFRSFDLVVNADSLGADEAAARRAEACDLQREEAMGVGA